MTRKEILLDGGNWELGQVMSRQGVDDVERWVPARVPGNVRGALLDAGLIEDPYYARQNELSRWVEDWNWYYKREFDADPGARRTFLRFEGVDYKCCVFVNGRNVVENEGMFAPIIIDISQLIKQKNTLSVNIEYSGSLRKRESTLKCQMGFGWDFAPALRSMGIWDSVSLVQTGDVYIRHVLAQPVRVTENYWELRVRLVLDALNEAAYGIELKTAPDNFDGEEKTYKFDEVVRRGITELVFDLPMKNPRLWQPWEEGEQNMYRLETRIRDGRRIVDNTKTAFGVREVELLPCDGWPEYRWTFVVNGRRKFIRGANWVPADSLPGTVTRERYRRLLQMARDANINMLRVWGGGLREKKDFYDICNELGIMIWQEFPFACPGGMTYPTTKAFRKLVDSEVTGILRTIHNHPSVVFYCGGNEFGQSWNRGLVKQLKKLVRAHGGGRQFSVTSPTEGESHNWEVFHMMANIGDYRREDCAFLSEFGMQSVPVRESLYKFMPPGNHWPVSPKMPYILNEFSLSSVAEIDAMGRYLLKGRERRNAGMWAYHNAQLMKLFHYAGQLDVIDVTTFIDATQKMQAHALQTAVEHMRRRRNSAGGIMFWQFNEPWPCVCWSVVDYYLQPKLAYEKVKQVYSPLLVSLEFDMGPYEPDQVLRSRIFVINDLHSDIKNLTITIRVTDRTGQESFRREIKLPAAAPDSIVELAPVDIALRGDGGQIIECTAKKGRKIICRNEYDLSVVDKKPTLKLLTLGGWIMHNIFWK